MTLKARTATTVIPAGCPMHNSSSSKQNMTTSDNDDKDDDTHDNNDIAYGGYKADNSKPIRVFKSSGRPLSGDAKKDWKLSKDDSAKKQKEKILLGFKTAFAILTVYIFIQICLKTSQWLYSVPEELLE